MHRTSCSARGDFDTERAIGGHLRKKAVLEQDNRRKDVGFSLKLVGDIRRERLVAILNPAKKPRLMRMCLWPAS